MKYLFIILLASCVMVRSGTFRVEQIRYAKGGYYVWFRQYNSVFSRFYQTLPDSIQVGRYVRLK